jgi:hypothetical protein
MVIVHFFVIYSINDTKMNTKVDNFWVWASKLFAKLFRCHLKITTESEKGNLRSSMATLALRVKRGRAGGGWLVGSPIITRRRLD